MSNINKDESSLRYRNYLASASAELNAKSGNPKEFSDALREFLKVQVRRHTAKAAL